MRVSIVYRLRVCLALVTALIVAPRAVLAHAGEPPAPHDLLDAWNWNPLLWLGLLLMTWGYLRGVQAQRQLRGNSGAPRWRTVAFFQGLAALFIALISPVDALSDALASAHMMQHMLLVIVAAPLLAISVPVSTLLLGLPVSVRYALGRTWRHMDIARVGWRWLSVPAVVWLLHAGLLWLWHASAFYEAALRDEFLHVLEHASFFSTALLFWRMVLHVPAHKGLGQGFGIFCVFTMVLITGLLGALMTFARTPWYAAYFDTTRAWGLTPLEDQQLAGVIMWVPMGLVYTAVALALFVKWLATAERAAQQREGNLNTPTVMRE